MLEVIKDLFINYLFWSDWNGCFRFEKLDSEASKDDESIGEVAQAEAHPLAEEGISFEIQRSSEEKDSTMYAILSLWIIIICSKMIITYFRDYLF